MGNIFRGVGGFFGRQLKKGLEESRDPVLRDRMEQEEADCRRWDDDRRLEAVRREEDDRRIEEERREMESREIYYRDEHHW